MAKRYLIPKSGISGIRPVTQNGIKWANLRPKTIRPTVFNKIYMVIPPKNVSCIGIRSVNTVTVSIQRKGRRCEYIVAKVRIHVSKEVLKNIFLSLCECEYRPHMYSRKNELLKFFPACIGFVPRGDIPRKEFSARKITVASG